METLEKLTDSEIISRILQGEQSLYEIIVRRYNPYLYKIGRSYNYHHEDTQDLMQETFIDAYKHLSQFESRANFTTWIIRIMINNCYRKRKNQVLKMSLCKRYRNSQIPCSPKNQTPKRPFKIGSWGRS